MLSKSLIKLVRSLDVKKFRKESGLFVAEGNKIVHDLLDSDIYCEKIIATNKWLAENNIKNSNAEIIATNESDLSRISFLRAPQGVMGIFRQRTTETDNRIAEKTLCLALDDIQDPGNLGTIIRIADWFGIENIFCSNDTADIYNPKSIQATMGAIGHVKIHYTDLPQFLESQSKNTPIYGTFLDGDNIYSKELSANGIIVMGNEGKGIGKECARIINKRLFIPNYPSGRTTSESLNVSTATAIICAEFRRRLYV